MALDVASVRTRSAARIPLACLCALLCLCAIAQPADGALEPPGGQGPPPGEQQPPPGQQQGLPPGGQQPPPGQQQPPGAKTAWVFFVNAFPEKALELYALGDGGHLQLMQVLEPGRLVKINARLGQNFDVAEPKAEQAPNAAKPARVVVRPLPGEDYGGHNSAVQKLWVCNRTTKGLHPSIECSPQTLEYRGEEWNKLIAEMQRECSSLLQNHPKDAAFFCHQDYSSWRMAQCLFDTSQEEFQWQYDAKQKVNHDGVIADHSHVKKFSMSGHTSGEMPAKLFQALRHLWREERLEHARPENHPRFSAVVPGCRADSFMLRPMAISNPQLRSQVIETLQPLVAKWAGLQAEDLEFTAMYGPRLYRYGSQFPFHRDIPFTHVLSAILEIGQLELDHPDPNYIGGLEWPLQIYDHAGNVHSYAYKPGQMIFYESFACAHGRPKAFEGREVASLFVHFKPKVWSPMDWDRNVQVAERKKFEL